MKNFLIQFSVSPWLLLLLIPFLGVTAFLYFRLEKRYRRKRNRVISVILHTIVSILLICTLSGMYFSWETQNVENELVLLVDASYSESKAGERVNSFVKEILEANRERSKIAIVTFGKDTRVALEMGMHDPAWAYNVFLDAEKPDTSATDYAAALKSVYDPTAESGSNLIENPAAARILVLSDGLQTDEDGLSAARKLSMAGIHVDTSFFPGSYGSDVWITSVKAPDRKLTLGDPFDFELSLKSNFEGSASLHLSDNGEEVFDKEGIPLSLGEQTVKIPHVFISPGHHELCFTLTCPDDTLSLNNTFFSYYDLEEYSRILVVEKYTDESKEIVDILKKQSGEEHMQIDVVQVGDRDNLPQSLALMQEYDEIVLVNIAYRDMPAGFERDLNDYVKERGGGLFTVGGVERDSDGQVITKEQDGATVPVSHAYQREDLSLSKYYQKMLPVDAVDFTPPVALAIVIDTSGSMAMESGGFSLIDYAISGAIGCLDVLSTRDYVGVMMMEDSYKVGLSMTPMSQKNKIVTAIRRIADGGGGGTYYASAIEQAGRALSAMQDVERKHILVISDGQPGDTLYQSGEFLGFGSVMQRYHDNFGITISIVSIGTQLSSDLLKLAEIGEGSAFALRTSEMDQMKVRLKEDLNFEELSGAVPMDFHPTVGTRTALLDGVTESALAGITMNGFFATRAKASGVTVPLSAGFGPLYAEWSYGAGKVGSFLCDLNGYWSKEFLSAEGVGDTIVGRAVMGLLPTVDIRAKTLDATFIEDNYHTQVSVYGYVKENDQGDKLVAFVESPGSDTQKFDLSEESSAGNRFTFAVNEVGVHRVTILKVPARFDVFSANYATADDVPDSQIKGIVKAYRVFSYSEEYDPSKDAYSDGKQLLIRMSSRVIEGEDTEEKLIDDAEEFLSVFISEPETFDPRMWFVGIAIVLFLLDIAIRKFKFKWPHEIIRERKEKIK